MKVDWTNNASRQKDKVADYIRDQFGYRYKKKFIQEVDKTIRMIMRHPNIGQMDPLFTDRSYAYRSIIIKGLSKLVYLVIDDTIYIVGFWDTRMDDAGQAAKIQEVTL